MQFLKQVLLFRILVDYPSLNIQIFNEHSMIYCGSLVQFNDHTIREYLKKSWEHFFVN